MLTERSKSFLKELEIKDPEQIKVWDEYRAREKTLDINMLIFHDFDIKKVKWKELFYWYENFCNKLNITPTRLNVHGVDGKPYNYSRDRKTLTYKGGKKKLEKYDFDSKMYSLFVSCMYHEKSYTSDFKSALSIFSSSDERSKHREVKLFFEESLYPFSLEKYQGLASILNEFTGAKYGYYHQLKLGMSPESYATGSHQCAVEDDKDEQRKLVKWNKVYTMARDTEFTMSVRKVGKKFIEEMHEIEDKSYKYKLGDLRQIYKLNFLTQEHLSRELSSGVTLEQWIKSSKNHGELKELKSGFWSWEVSEQFIACITKALSSSGIILCL